MSRCPSPPIRPRRLMRTSRLPARLAETCISSTNRAVNCSGMTRSRPAQLGRCASKQTRLRTGLCFTGSVVWNPFHAPGRPIMEKFIHREHLAIYRKGLAEPHTDAEQEVFLNLLAEE